MPDIKEEITELAQKDVKCRFFAQYWGQLYEFKNTKTKFTVNEGAFPLEKEGNERLILTDLKNITDEDALAFVPFISKNFSSRYTDDYIKEQIKKEVLDAEKLPAKFYDILRSRGYAVPFMEYSVEDLIEKGWVRLV